LYLSIKHTSFFIIFDFFFLINKPLNKFFLFIQEIFGNNIINRLNKKAGDVK